MTPIVRYAGTIVVTAIVAFAAVVGTLGAPSAGAQPAPQTVEQPRQTSDTGAVPAPTVQQVDKGAASSSAVGSDNAAPGPQPAAGAGSAGAAAGSAGAGSAGAAAGSAGAAAGSAAPAAGAKPTIAEVSCENARVETTLNGVVDAEVAVGTV